ncbi:MAG: hypothetical protein LCH41_10635 [Armatimonadetes bacterium]|nr:hypothetical protein [Armatimonadota bacterium]
MLTPFRQVIRLGIAWRVCILLGLAVLLAGLVSSDNASPEMLWVGICYGVAGLIASHQHRVLTRTLGRTSATELGEVLRAFHPSKSRLIQLVMGDILRRGLPRITRRNELTDEEWGIVAALVQGNQGNLAKEAREAILRSGVEGREFLDHQARLIVDAAWCRRRADVLFCAVVLACATPILLTRLMGIQEGVGVWYFATLLAAATAWFVTTAEKPKKVIARSPLVAVELARGVLGRPFSLSWAFRFHALEVALKVTERFDGLSFEEWSVLMRASRTASPSGRQRIFQGARESAPPEILPLLAEEAAYWSARREKGSHASVSAITAARLELASRPPELRTSSAAPIQEVP